jgi:MOSC domain-containing protein
MNAGVVTEVWIYPVKACHGISLAEAVVELPGLRHDRRWMVVDEAGKGLTQRDHPELARIAVSISADRIQFRCDGCEELELPLGLPLEATVTVTIWGTTVSAASFGSEVDGWFARFLERAVRVVALTESTRRPVDPAFAKNGEIVSFADGYPSLLTAEESLAELNRRLANPVPMNRFRPNIVIRGARPFEEDGWQVLRIGSAEFQAAKPCERCIVTTIDQESGQISGKEPLRTLATFRRRNGATLFGMNLLVRRPGIVRVGDLVTIDTGTIANDRQGSSTIDNGSVSSNR